MVVWPFPPNWANSFMLTRQFKTDIITSRSQREQRRALRQEPRKKIEFSMACSGAAFRAFQRTMHESQDATFLVGDESRSTHTTESFGGVDNTVTVEAGALWMQAGQGVILRNGSTLGYREIESRAGDVLTFVDDSNSALDDGETWNSGTLVMPALQAYLPDELGTNLLTNSVNEFTLEFQVVPGSELLTPDDSNSVGGLEIHEGREVFLFKPNYAQAPQITFSDPTEFVDFGVGRLARYTPSDFRSERRQCTYLSRNQDECLEFGSFFERHYGACVEFWAPTWQNDLPLTVSVGANTNEIPILGIETHDAYEGSPVHQNIMILLDDDTKIYRKVVGITIVNDSGTLYSVLELDNDVGVNLTTANVVMISWLLVMRFSSDEFTLEMVTNDVGQAQITMQSLEALDQDAIDTADSNSLFPTEDSNSQVDSDSNSYFPDDSNSAWPADSNSSRDSNS